MRVRGLIVLATAMSLVAGSASAAGLRKGYAMCRDEHALHRLLAASAANDGKAFRRLMHAGCRPIDGNERVKIATRRQSLARVVVKGRGGSWWTVAEALR